MANKGERVINVRDPARVLETHVDKYVRSRTGSVLRVHHVATGKWMSMKEYYALQKAHEVLPLLAKMIEGGYRTNAAIYSLMPSVALPGISIPIPAGPALLGFAILDVLAQLAKQPPDPLLLAKAIYKVVGPFGAVLQTAESIQGILEGVEGLLAPPSCDELKTRYELMLVNAAANIPPGADYWRYVAQTILDAARSRGCDWAAPPPPPPPEEPPHQPGPPPGFPPPRLPP